MKNMKKFIVLVAVVLHLGTASLYSSNLKEDVSVAPSPLMTLAKKVRSEVVESGKIVAGSILAACLYGIINDSVTVRVCPEYFTEGFHKEMLRPWWKSGPNSKITDMLLNPNNKR